MQPNKKERRAKRKRKKAERKRKRHTMKRIKIPDDILIKGVDGTEKDHSFKKFLTIAIESNEKYGKGLSNIKRGMALSKIVEENCKGETLVLENADYDSIRESIDNAQWLPPIIFQMTAFLEAIENAETFEVKETPKEEAKESGQKEPEPEPSEKE